ncbi:MAG: hypothetical protein FWH59_03210 [Lentimicrobiaceae bacterium]|nr:hypothetical protein [Lentimicrobiaceae bacterium]
MAHDAKLKIEGKEYKVIECDYEFVQSIKENGQPAGYTTGGIIHITVASPDDNDTFLHTWMESSIDHIDGEINFVVVDTNAPSKKTVKFKRAYCIGLHEFINTQSVMQMTTKITISAAEITFGNSGNEVTFENY